VQCALMKRKNGYSYLSFKSDRRLKVFRYLSVSFNTTELCLLCTQVEILWRLMQKLLIVILPSILHPMRSQVPVCLGFYVAIQCTFVSSFHTYAKSHAVT